MNTSRRLPSLFIALLALAMPATRVEAQVTTWRYDSARTGQNLAETKLTPANVNSATFGKLRSYKVDGFVYAQPLYLPGLNIAGSTHNVVFIATEHDSVYAFDADHNVQLWSASLVDLAHGALAGATSVPSADLGTSDLVPEVGITATPVIDPATGTIYVEAKSKEAGGYVHRLHALDVLTGHERLGSPVVIQPSIPGTGSGSVDGMIVWQPQWQLERPGMLLLNGKVYMAFASHGDNGPFHGWVLGYDATTLQPAGVYNTAPNGREAGIWESGAGLAADTVTTGGRMFVVIGNGDTWDGLPYTDAQSYGNAVEALDLSNGIHVVDQWTPYDTLLLSASDIDQGSGGIVLLPDQPGAHPHELVQVGKNGRIELLDRDNLGGFDPNTNHIVQEISGQVGGLWSTPAYWNDNLYIWASNDTLKQFSLQNGLLSQTPTAQSSVGSGFPGASPVITSNGKANGIVWALHTDEYGQGGPALLFAFDATNVGKLLYSSQQNTARDTAGPAVKFTVPLVVDGQVIVGAQGEVDVYGLLATASPVVPTVTFSPVPGTYPTAQSVTLSVAASNAVIYYTTDGTVPTASSPRYNGTITVTSTTSIQAFAAAPGDENSSITTATYVIGTAPTVSFSNGFASTAGLTLNGSAVHSDDSRLQLTTGGFYQAGSAFTSSPVNIQSFISDYTFQLSGIPPLADGYTFTIQNSSPHALGPNSGGLGYGPASPNGAPGIDHSIAIKFDLWNNLGEGIDSTGLYVNGASPTIPATDMSPTGLNLSSGDTMRAHIVYDGHTLFLTVTDPVARTAFATNFSIDIPSTIGSNTAFAGFTAATGGLYTSQKILTWNFWSDPDLGPPPPVPTPVFTPAPAVYFTPQAVTIADSLSGTTLHYTIDGSTPTASSPAYTGPVTLTNTTLLRAIGVANGYPDSTPAKGTYIFPVTTAPTLAAPAPVAVGKGTSGPLVEVTGDFNGDGKADLALINAVDSSVTVLLGNGDGSFQPAVNYPVAKGPSWMVAGDFNNDGRLDLAVASGLLGKLTILLNAGSGGFVTFSQTIPSGATHLSAGDFNHDGHLDLALTYTLKSQIDILSGTGNGSFQTGPVYPVGKSPLGTTVADFNNDGQPDLVVWNSVDNTISLLLNDGTGSFLPLTTYAVGTTPCSAAAGDLNEDGFPDLAVTNCGSNTVSVLLNDGTGKLQPPMTYATGTTPVSILAADMNGDGVLDLTIANQGSSSVSVLIGKADGTFLPGTSAPLPAVPYMAATADFNGDGMPDLAISNFAQTPAAHTMKTLTSTTGAAPLANSLTILLQTAAAH